MIYKFFLADGSLISSISNLPVTPEQTDVVYNGKQGRAWIWDIAIDKTDNNPVLVYARFPTVTFQDHRYHYVKRTSKGKF